MSLDVPCQIVFWFQEVVRQWLSSESIYSAEVLKRISRFFIKIDAGFLTVLTTHLIVYPSGIFSKITWMHASYILDKQTTSGIGYLLLEYFCICCVLFFRFFVKMFFLSRGFFVKIIKRFLRLLDLLRHLRFSTTSMLCLPSFFGK